MTKTPDRSNVGDVAGRLRALALAREDGAWLGREDALQRELAVSKPTIRQAARMLEREGLLKVRRGNSGGYFAARPDPGFIEETVASYLEVLHARPEDLTRVASALWIETVRQAASIGGDDAAALARRFRRAISKLPADAPLNDVQPIEQALRQAVFALVESPYIELLFDINANFARRKFSVSPAAQDGSDHHRAFVTVWKKAALLLVDALADGDEEVATLAARRGRQLLHERIWR